MKTPEPLEPLVRHAVADLARRLSIDAARIVVVDARSVAWPDSSLGCPRPGMMYLQVLQDGVQIRLRVGRKEYAYHSGGRAAPFLCGPKGPA
jgi:hypothetical protein